MSSFALLFFILGVFCPGIFFPCVLLWIHHYWVLVIVSGQLANKLCNAAGEDVEAKDYDQTWLGTTLILGMLATPLGIYVHSSKPPPLDGVLLLLYVQEGVVVKTESKACFWHHPFINLRIVCVVAARGKCGGSLRCRRERRKVRRRSKGFFWVVWFGHVQW